MCSFPGGYQTSPQQIPIPKKPTTEIPKPKPQLFNVFQGLVPRTVPWVKIVGSWWLQVSGGGFLLFRWIWKNHPIFIGDIWIFMEGWWDNTDFQVRVVVQIFVMCFPRKFWGRMKSNLIGIFFQMGWLKPATRKWFFDSSPYQFFMLCYFQWSHFWEENTCF